MNQIRASLRLVAFAVVLFVFYCIRLVRRGRTGRRWVFRNLSRAIVRIVGMRIRVEGPAPAGAFLLVSNHLSYADIVLLASQLDCVFVAKLDVRSWPVLGLIIEQMDTIFVDRTSRGDVVHVNEQIERTLEAGDGVVLFAEGTSSSGDTVLPLKPSLLEFAAQRNFPVSYATVTYRTPECNPPAHESVCWWGNMTFADHFFDLLKLPWFEARVVFGENTVRESNRKGLARRLHENIARRLTPVGTPHLEDQ